MLEVGFLRTFQFRNNALSEDFAEFDAPLIEGVDIPKNALREDAHFVERDETPKRGGSEFFPHNDTRRAVALEDAVRGKTGWRAIGLNFVECFSKGEGFGLAHAVIEQILGFVLMRSSSHASAQAILSDIAARYLQTAEGVAELVMVLTMLKDLGVPEKNYALNFSIARGLDYYTGTVYETTLDDYPQIGSICSGGRYDNLASHYSKSKLPGVGISIGASRLFWQLREAGLIAPDPHNHMVLIGLMRDEDLSGSLAMAAELRAAGIACEVQLEAKKLAKQFQYADKVGFSYMILFGESEQAKGVVSLKNLATGKQVEIARADLLRCLSQAKEWGL